ncbi:MAG: helix-turn-helix domain-containing protein [Pseudomonadales bacterium]|nr:helix-turn-helix domain-containing protein [Pseudomonadales bacterium]NRA17016.1 helix-turn-helix domain-containing protein [Oceanospirillaceae bacterium]
MPNSSKTRQFSASMLDTNCAFLPAGTTPSKTIKVGFILLQHFSMMSFTAAVDVLITANLVQSKSLFTVDSYALQNCSVTSDLGIDIAVSGPISEIELDGEDALNILIVCGGLRCNYHAEPKLTRLLQAADNKQLLLGSLWNGVIALAQASTLHDLPCALHLDNHALMQEQHCNVNLTQSSYSITPRHISCVDAIAALEMMLKTVERLKGPAIARAVKEILSCSRSSDQDNQKLVQSGDSENFPEKLRSAIQLMNSNIEEPIAIEEMASYLQTSRRQIERLFKLHLHTSPSRHYLEIRLTYARRLLLQSDDSITNIAIACGFVSSNHFSNCFRDYFKAAPSSCRNRKPHSD